MLNEEQKAPQKPGNTKKRNRSFHFQYVRMRRAIDLSLNDPVLQENLANFGFGPEKIAVGKSLLDKLQQSDDRQKDERDAYLASARIFREKRKEASTVYMRYVRTARLIFQDDTKTANNFHLQAVRRRDYAGWLVQALLFYKSLLDNPKLLEKLEEFKITHEELEAGKQLVMDTESAGTQKTDAYAESQRATEAKNKAHKEMQTWFSDFIGVAKIALKNDRQKLEKLGVVMPSAY